MRSWTHILVLLTALLPAAQRASAVAVENLYRAEVAVADHSQRQLQGASREALAQVLVKVSGSGSVLENPQVRDALSRSQRFMQRYQYLRDPEGNLRLQVHYDSQLVTELLRDAQAPLWTANRPPLLIWLVVDDGRERRFASADNHPEMLAALGVELDRRGVPAVFPLYDLEDTLALGVHDLWQLDALPIYRASQRYGVANILVGRVTLLSGGRSMGEWLYLQQQRSAATSFYGSELREFSALGIDFVADRMAERYAIAAGDSQGQDVLIRVDALGDYRDYQKVISYFEGIELIDSAWPAYVEGDSIIFRLRAQAQAEQLHRIIALNRRLQREDEPTPLNSGALAASLAYRWNP